MITKFFCKALRVYYGVKTNIYTRISVILTILIFLSCGLFIVAISNNKQEIIPIAGAFIAIVSILITAKIFERGKYREAVKESVKIAQIFQDKLIHDISLVNSVYNKNGIEAFLDSNELFKNRSSNTLFFDYEEATNIFGKDWEDRYRELLRKTTPKMIRDAFYNSSKYKIELNQIKIPDEVSKEEAGKKIEKISERNDMSHFDLIHDNTMNTLEWMSMLLNTGTANDSVIYQSLHQMILRYIRLCYLDICAINIRGEVDKYYCNMIDLYNRWGLCKLKATKKEIKYQKKIEQEHETQKGKILTRAPKV